MPHPQISDILAHLDGEATDPGLDEHLAVCAPCRQLAGLGDPFADRALVELVTVDPALYGRREPLGDSRGGMGRAFRAWDRRLGREVVIKQIRGVDDPALRAALRARFEREARVTARLHHPGIVGVLELGAWPDGEPFYTMPLVGGVPLDLAIAEAATLAARLALLPRLTAAVEAVAFAHDRGVIHRDIKPANILLGRFGETQVIDWGLARAIGEPDGDGGAPFRDEPGDGLTRMGVGTPQYMPPEQARGETPDARVDVYAIGATLYHLLAGEPPYGRGDGGSVRDAVRLGPPAPLAEVAPDAPRELVAICDKAMAREPARRFASALEVAHELGRYQTGQLTRTHQYSAGEIVRHWLRRHRAVVRVGAAALVALIAIGGLAVWRVVQERDRAAAGERRARLAAAEARDAQASALAPDPARRLEALEQALAAADVTGRLAPGLVAATTAGPGVIALPGQETALSVSFAPGGDRFVTIDGDGGVAAWDAVTGARLAAIDSALERPFWAVWSPDGARVAITALESDVEVWSPASGERRVVDAGAQGDAAQPTAFAAWADDGALLTAAGDGTLRRWDAGGTRRAEGFAGCAVSQLVAGRIGAVAACADGGVAVWDGEVRRLDAGAGPTHLALSPDGARLYSGAAGQVLAWDGDRARLVHDTGAAPIWGIQVSPDGAYLAVGTGILELIDLASGAVQHELALAVQRDPPAPGAPRWFGQHGTTMIGGLDVATRELVVRLRGHRRFDRVELAGTARGDRVVSVTSSGEAWLWDARLGEGSGALAEHDAEVIAVASEGDRITSVAIDGSMFTSRRGDGAILAAERAGTELVAAATDGGAVLAGGSDGTARLWSGGAARVLAHGGAPVSAVALGDVAVTGGLDGTIAIWPRAGDAAPVRIDAGGDAVRALRLGAGWIASGHRSGAIRVWSRQGEEMTDRISLPAEERARLAGTAAVAMEPPVVASASRYTSHPDGTIAAGDAFTIPDAGLGAATALHATADGRWLIAGYASGAVRLHPVTLASARARACSILAFFGRAPASCSGG